MNGSESSPEEYSPSSFSEWTQREGSQLSWRRVLIGAFVAGLGFFGLSLLTWTFPLVAFLVGAVFLPVGLWVGRGSEHPWLEGLLYGVSAAVIVIGIMVASSLLLQEWSLRFALLLAIPQGVLGTWIGARFLSHSDQEEGAPPGSTQESDPRTGPTPP